MARAASVRVPSFKRPYRARSIASCPIRWLLPFAAGIAAFTARCCSMRSSKAGTPTSATVRNIVRRRMTRNGSVHRMPRAGSAPAEPEKTIPPLPSDAKARPSGRGQSIMQGAFGGPCSALSAKDPRRPQGGETKFAGALRRVVGEGLARPSSSSSISSSSISSGRTSGRTSRITNSRLISPVSSSGAIWAFTSSSAFGRMRCMSSTAARAHPQHSGSISEAGLSRRGRREGGDQWPASRLVERTPRECRSNGRLPELTEALIRQVSRNGDGTRIETPYLQLALKRLWEEERRLGSTNLRWETLNALGGASGIAKSHFEDTMKARPRMSSGCARRSSTGW